VGLPVPGAGYESTADLVPARGLDFATKDYEVDDDETGVPHGSLDPLQQNVALRLTTQRGSLPFDRTFGNDFLNLTKLPLDLVGFARACADQALADLIASNQVEVLDVQADRTGGLAVMSVTWRDLRTGREPTTTAKATGTP
jgi:phage gp46-like protein